MKQYLTIRAESKGNGFIENTEVITIEAPCQVLARNKLNNYVERIENPNKYKNLLVVDHNDVLIKDGLENDDSFVAYILLNLLVKLSGYLKVMPVNLFNDKLAFKVIEVKELD